MNQFICPSCQKPLRWVGNSYRCNDNHTFDIAKSGYVNLLLSNNKHSKMPGDNKIMVDARQAFLDKGYYTSLSDCLCMQVGNHMGMDEPFILDVGCGEGYYTSNVYTHLTSKGFVPHMMGIDISKIALNKAAKRNHEIDYAVASVFNIPVAQGSCDFVLNLFAPYCGEEFQRVLKQDGKMVVVIPGEHHLWELKQSIYDQPYKNEVKDYVLDGFQLVHTEQITQQIMLDNQQDIDNLFKMTPYYYKTSEQDYKRLVQLTQLTTTIAFDVLVYIRNEINIPI